MEVANASMYDGSTGAAEAVLMAHRVTRRAKALLSGGLHPQYRDVIETDCALHGFERRRPPADPKGTEDLFAAIDDKPPASWCRPPTSSAIPDLTRSPRPPRHGRAAGRRGDRTRLARPLKPPGDLGADIVVGEGQAIGNALSFGGPYVGLFATREKFVRQMPGRSVGETVDAEASAATC